MDPLSLLVGAMAGAFIAVVVMALLRSGDDDDDLERALDEAENAPQQDGGLTMPDRRRLH